MNAILEHVPRRYWPSVPLSNDERRAIWAMQFYACGHHRQIDGDEYEREECTTSRYVELTGENT